MGTMQRLILTVATLFAFLAATRADTAGAADAPRPNIVLIMCDDMGFSDIGCYGSEIQTPNLDRLAAGGLRFTQFYNAARCCPTRAALLTGLYPHQAGMGGMVSGKGGTDSVSAYQGYLNDRCVTIAEVLRTAGYHTAMSGKWHVGESRPSWPTDRGFEHYFGLISGASNYWKLDGGRKMALDDQPYTPPDDGSFYMTDAISDHAVKMVDQYGGKTEPFFLYVAYTAPHWPIHAWPEDIAKYEGKYMAGWEKLREERHARMIEMGIVDKRWPLSPLDAQPWDKLSDKEKRDFDLKMAVYAAMIDRVDQGIGRIMAKVKAVGAEQNTLVMFLADNGGCHEDPVRSEVPGTPPGPKESFLAYGKNWANASNTPFRRYKHWVHEGGIATPLVAHWPAAIKSGSMTDQVGHVIDLMATCVNVAGASYPDKVGEKSVQPLEGRSLLPILQGQQRTGHETLCWEHFGNRAVRQGDWKLVAAGNGSWELYNVKEDRTELNDLAKQLPDKLSEMVGWYDAWAKRVGVRGAK
jgi:arylsulfatase A-like enzyme